MSAVKPTEKHSKSPRVNWHEAAVCALQIDLRDYNDLLEYITEYVLGKNGLRIDLLVDQSGARNEYSALNVSLTFLSLRRPRRLITHLCRERNLTVAKAAPGVYHIIKETFPAQIIVTAELSAEDYLYLRCLTGSLAETGLADRLAADCGLHREQEVYIRYLHQLTHANAKTKGESLMVCEGLLNLFGTSSEEIIERTRQEDNEYYLPKIEALTARNTYLKSLLREHNIPFDQEAENTAN